MLKERVLLLVCREGRLLHGISRAKDYTRGYLKAFGGLKVEGESLQEACRRHAKAEADIEVGHMAKVAVNHYSVGGIPYDTMVHVFRTDHIEGTPRITDRMYGFREDDIHDLPFGLMFPDDRYWLEKALMNGCPLISTFKYQSISMSPSELWMLSQKYGEFEV